MTNATITRTVAARPAANGLFAALRRSVQDRLAKRAVYLRTLNELQACSDRDLADLGFARSELTKVARDSAGL